MIGGPVKWFNERAKLIGEINPSLGFSANWSQEQSTGNLKFSDATGTLGLELKGTLQVKLVEHVQASGYVSGSGSITVGVPQPFVRKMGVTFESGVNLRIDAFWSSVNLSKKATFGCTWTPSNGTKCGKDDASKSPVLSAYQSDNDVPLSLIQPDYARFGRYSVFSPNELLIKPRSSVIPLSVSETSFLTNVFPGASPYISQAGSGTLLMWVHQDPALPVLQSTGISWSYSNGLSWTTPALIATDNRVELSPVAGVDSNGKVVAAWLRIKDALFTTPVDTTSNLPLFYNRLDVVTSVFDPSIKTWGAVSQVTDDNVFDNSLRLSSDNGGQLLLSWLSNPGGEFTSNTISPSKLNYSLWNGSSWVAPATIDSNMVGVNSHAAAIKGTNAFIVVPRDPDSNVTGDGVLDLYKWNGSIWSGASAFAAGGVENRLPSAVYDTAGEGHVVWLRGNDLVHATLSDPTPRVVRSGSSSMAFYNIRLLNSPQGILTLVWQEAVDNGPANIFTMLYDPTTQTWSADRRLNEDQALAHDVHGYYSSDGRLHLAYLATKIDRTTDTVVVDGETETIINIPQDGQTDLRLLDHSLIVDLSVADNDIIINPQQPQEGDYVTALVDVHNAGDFAVGNFVVSLYAGDPNAGGVLLGTITVSDSLRAGDHRAIPFTFTLPASSGNLIAVVDPNNSVAEFSKFNNRATLYLNNTAPQATVTANVTGGGVPLTVDFDASSSFDNEGDALSFTWTFADGSPSVSGIKVSHTFNQPGIYPVTVTVTDAHGAVGTSVVNITVGSSIQLDATSYSVSESSGSIQITVTRAGDVSHAATVDYSTTDGTAKERTDYTTASGTLIFAPGEISKFFNILVSDNAYVDGDRTITLTLSNPSGAFTTNPSTAVLTIIDNDTATATTNPIDDAQSFVRQQYSDFLNRMPDVDGLGYWTDQITQCGTNAQCIHDRRVGVADAFFFENEFQQTGAYIYRLYKSAFGSRPTYAQFISDRGRVVVGTALDQSKSSFALTLVQRDAFLQIYPRLQSAGVFLDTLLNNIKQNSGVDLTSQRSTLSSLYDGTDTGRAAILRRVADSQSFTDAEYNSSFVLMEYFGYLRRDPDQGGFDFWLGQVNKFPIRDVGIQHAMACSFITSAEYQTRFSSVVTHTNQECPQ